MIRQKLLLGAVFVLLCSMASVEPHHSYAAITSGPSIPPPGSTFDQRLALRKDERKEQLDPNTVKQLQQQCIGAQGVIRVLISKTAPMLAHRTLLYRKIDGVLYVNIGQLKLTPLSTFTLEQNRIQYAQLVADYQTLSDAYQQTLNDILVINCSSDVVGFQALLDTARLYYAELILQTDSIYNYVVNTAQPTLESFVPKLQPDAKESQ